MESSVLLVKDLWKSFGSVDAVKGLTFELSKGEFFGLLGPNGAGKTTTIGLLTGLIRPKRGQVVICGVDLFSHPMEAKPYLGFVPQNFALYPTLTARENLAFFGKLYGLKGNRLEERIAFVLNFVSLTDRANQTVATFSNGMKRRLNIAAGLLHEPDLLILDEPTVGVDPQSRMAILENLHTLHQFGVTILYTTHYIEEAQRLCDRVAIMDYGEIIALDTPVKLIQDLGKGMIHMEFQWGVSDSFIEQMKHMGSVKILNEQKSILNMETDQTNQVSRDLLDLIKKQGEKLKNFHLSEPNLETVFIHLTGRTLRDS